LWPAADFDHEIDGGQVLQSRLMRPSAAVAASAIAAGV
jgi:hypothetical protein